MRECPKCHGMLEDDGSCSCGYGVKRRQAAGTSAADSVYCAWSDHGQRCPCRGLISASTGGGSFYCREHWERINHREPYGVGNAAVPMGQSHTAQEWHKAMDLHKARFGGRSLAQHAAKEFLPHETVEAFQERIKAGIGGDLETREIEFAHG